MTQEYYIIKCQYCKKIYITKNISSCNKCHYKFFKKPQVFKKIIIDEENENVRCEDV
ncbi:MAG: hypothetical protein QXG18_02770 [Candidatus Pacearchaeota archaeon]